MKTQILILSLFLAGGMCTHAQEFQKPDPAKWYRLVSRYNGSDPQRINVCIEYYPEGSAHPNLLWTAAQAQPGTDEYEYQLWRFEPSADNPDEYAMICKAAPDGYVNINPTAIDRSGRWEYIAQPTSDEPDNKYGFVFITSETMSGVDASSGNSYCAIGTTKTVSSSYCMNAGAAAQDYAVNLWYETYSEDANEWSFAFEEHQDDLTSVNTVSDDMAEKPAIHDLYGRRVSAPSSGNIYIIAGKKVLFSR